MKLLLDQNLSPHLATDLQDRYPGTTHVRELGFERAPDPQIWDFAKQEGFVILSKDADFHQLSFLYGHPPKVIWVSLGNCTTTAIRGALQSAAEDIAAFEADEDAAFLRLS